MFIIKQINDVPKEKVKMWKEVAVAEGAVQVSEVVQLDGKVTLILVFNKPGANVAAAALKDGATVGIG